MLQHLHHHWLNGWHFDKGKALLQQFFKLPISVSFKETMQNNIQAGSFRKHDLKSKTTNDTPVLVLALRNDGNSFHQLVSKLIKDRLVELEPRCSMEVEEGKSWLEGWQQDAIFHLQACYVSKTHQRLVLAAAVQFRTGYQVKHNFRHLIHQWIL